MNSLTEEPKTLFVDGAWGAGSGVYERRDPAAPGRVTGRFSSATPEDVDRAYEAAARAGDGWRGTPAPARSQILRRAADLLERDAASATERLIADMGKARRDARAEVDRTVAIFRYFSGELLQPHGETYPSSDPAVTLFTIEAPLGVVCVITPWNFPFAIPAWKLAPALGFANTVVWKPAEAASGSAVFLAQALEEAGLPAGVLNLVTGKGSSLSEALTSNPRLAALTFTGSGPTGVRLRQAVADRNVKVQLELGGKNPAIVLADADLADAATQIARGAMGSTGQRCTATGRVYVEQPVADAFIAMLKDAVESMRVGDPYDDSTDIGPLASKAQRQAVAGFLEIARREQATVITDGDLNPNHENYLSPVVLTDVEPRSALFREEIFGPVLVVQTVENFDAALASANDTEFGLSSAVFTRDIGKAMKFVRETQSGLVHINRETAGAEPHVPFGGIKGSSSLAREQGKAAREFFTFSKTVYLRATA